MSHVTHMNESCHTYECAMSHVHEAETYVLSTTGGWHSTRRNTRLRTLQHALQHTATHCNTLQHTATHCNRHGTKRWRTRRISSMFTLQHLLQHTTTHCNTSRGCRVAQTTLQSQQHALQHTTTHYNTLQHITGLQNVTDDTPIAT